MTLLRTFMVKRVIYKLILRDFNKLSTISALPSWNINTEKAIIQVPNNNIVNFFNVFIERFISAIIINKMPINNTRKYQNPIKPTPFLINLFNSVLLTN